MALGADNGLQAGQKPGIVVQDECLGLGSHSYPWFVFRIVGSAGDPGRKRSVSLSRFSICPVGNLAAQELLSGYGFKKFSYGLSNAGLMIVASMF